MYQENQEEIQGNSFPMEAFSPTLWLDMSIKSILLFAFMWIISRIIDKNIRFDNQNVTDGKREFISTTIVFLEVVVQIVVVQIVVVQIPIVQIVVQIRRINQPSGGPAEIDGSCNENNKIIKMKRPMCPESVK